ncbi:MAG: sigma-70 family RNA polymerase sigma factor [Lentisphaeraceae bacterium]|nr:sigma-70 family RNA polymerase sigma factor [Lentisphaeraceae bacterium]
MSESLNTRKTLIERVRKLKDNDSWEDFVHYYRAYIFAVIQGMGLSNQEAEDLSQKVLLKLWKSLPEFEYRPNKCKFRTWLCTVVRSVVFSDLRAKNSRGKGYERFKADSDEDAYSLPEIEQLANQEWKSHIGKMAWENIKDCFTDKVIEAFMLFSEGLTTPEIAEKLGVEANTVNVYKKRVRDKLCKEINLLDSELA